MVRFRRQTEGLAHEKRSAKLEILLAIFNAFVFFIALSGLVGMMVFSCVHGNTFS